ncbi:MAG TPA: dockerin type I domain-containing protein [Tepidisphaeraceae bacterium]
MSFRPNILRLHRLALFALTAILAATSSSWATDVSAPVILQCFEGSYGSIENRMPDIFAAGYGQMYTPPPGRADSSNQSVGYDQYDRFDLGYAGNPTLYGTETGLRTTVNAAHRAGLSYGIDMVWNHAGFSNLGTTDGQGHSFYDAGGYPGLNITLPNDIDGDFHSATATGDYETRLAGLVDIAQEKNYPMIRSPVDPGNPLNIRPGTTAAFGRLANVANPNNARYYPDTSLQPIMVFDPKTGEQNIPIYPFNNANPMAGDAVPENALGYLMRNTQWLAQSVGVDMFRIDAAKNMPPWVLDYYDRAVYRASPRPLLDGSPRNVFGFAEVYDGDWNVLKDYVRKDINPAQPGTIGGNRDVLDFPLFFAMRNNLSSNGLQNDWNNVIGASFDLQDDGLMNGSQGVHFVSSADDFGPDLGNVAHAYTLMLPGNSLVYMNAQEFGTNRSFPKAGRADALGGLYGNAITTLVDLRNRYGRGDYHTRLLEKENLAFERDNSCIVLLSNRGDAGFDSRTIQTDFSPGTYLIELTGNASNPADDPNGDIPQLLQVKSDKTVDVRFLRNKAPGTNTYTGAGYLIYGLPSPQGQLSLSNVASTLSGWDKNVTGMNADQAAFANATKRLADVSAITANAFDITLRTNKVNLLDNPAFRDHDADGDNALLKIDDGLDLNGNGVVDNTAPGETSYGFENFVTLRQPGYTSADNNGTYTQTIDVANLSEGYHYLTARAYRHRDDGGPAIFTDWRKTIYVDRLPPNSTVASFGDPTSTSQNRDLIVKSLDQTANSVHVFLDLPANLSDAQILAMVGQANHTGQYDRDLFRYGFGSVSSGNHVATIVSFEITGNKNVQRVPGLFTQTTRGSGLGDLNYNNGYEVGDVFGTSYGLEAVLYSQNSQFNPAADLNADGRIDNKDLWLLRPRYVAAGAPPAVVTEARNAELRRGNVNGDGATNSLDIDYLYHHFGSTSWSLDMAADGGEAGQSDVDAMVHHVFLTEYGDADLNGKVDQTDLGILAMHWQSTGAGWSVADFSGDGVVDVTDLDLLASHWLFGSSPTAGTSISNELASLGLPPVSTGVPEPVSTTLFSLLGLAASAAGRARRATMRCVGGDLSCN